MRVARRICTIGLLATVGLALTISAAALAYPAIAPPTAATYGAIAVNPSTGLGGISGQALSRADAQRQARQACPGRCRGLLWVRDQCAAAVATPAWFWGGWGASRRSAIAHARLRARDRDAQLVAWTCSASSGAGL